MAGADGARPAWVPEALFGFAPRWVQAAGARLHYVDEGQGPVLLLVHGNPTWSFLYRDVIAALRGAFRCVAVDLPGFGLSGVPPGFGYSGREHARVLRAFVEELDLRDLCVMGQDWGGPIGLGMAGWVPERVAGVIVGNTWAWSESREPGHRLWSWVLGGPPAGVLVERLNLFATLAPALGVRRRPLGPEVREAYRRPFADPQRRQAIRALAREVSSGPYLAEVRRGLEGLRDRPALLVWGDADPLFRTRERERFEALFPRHETRILRGAGHFIQEDAPQEIAGAIAAWHPRAVAAGG